MKIQQHFKDIAKPDDIDSADFVRFKRELYGSAIFFETKTKRLLAKLKKLSEKDTFEVLRSKFGESWATDQQLTELGELIAYKIARGKISTKAKFDAELKSATLNQCVPGAVTNLQKILYSMDDSLYSQKYDFIQNQALEYIRQNKLASPGFEVHTANALIHEASGEYRVIPPRDRYANYRNLSIAPQEHEKKRAGFKDYIDRIFNSREGVYTFSEVVANGYFGKMPDAPKDGAKFKSKTIDGFDSPALVDIKALTETLKITIDSIIEYSEDEQASEFKYKDNYHEIIQAAVMHKLIKEDIVDLPPLTYETKIVNIIPGSKIPIREAAIDEDGKPLYDEDGTPVYKLVKNEKGQLTYNITPEKVEEKTEIRFVIESSGGWFLAREENDTLVVERKLIDSSKLQGLTLLNSDLQDGLHSMLSTDPKKHMSFEDAIESISTSMLYHDASSLDLETTVLLMSDQASRLQKHYTKEGEEKDLLSQEEVAELIKASNGKVLKEIVKTNDQQDKASNGKVLQEIIDTKDPQDIAMILASYAKPETFFKYIENTGITLSEGAQFICFYNALLHKNDALLENLLDREDFRNAKYNANDTALTSAAFIGNGDAIKKLIERNLDIYALKSSDRNAFDIALDRGNFEAFHALYEHHKKNVESGTAKFEDFESDWTKRDKSSGNYFSHRAVLSGNEDIVKYLIENKIFTVLFDAQRRTPFTIASNRKDKKMLLTIINSISEKKDSGGYESDELTYSNMIDAVGIVLKKQSKPDVKVKEAIIESKLDISEIKNSHILYVVSGDKFQCHNSFIKRIQDRPDKDEISSILKQGFGTFYDNKKIWKAVESLLDSGELKQNKLDLVKKALPNIKNYSRKKRLISCLSAEDQQALMQDPIMHKPTWREYFFEKPKSVVVASVRVEEASVTNTGVPRAEVKPDEKAEDSKGRTKSKSQDLAIVISDPDVMKAAYEVKKLERRMRFSQVRSGVIHEHQQGRRNSV